MAALVKVEVPEATEFDVYLDVDGAADDVPNISSDGGVEPASILEGRTGAIGASWYRSEAQLRPGPSTNEELPDFQLIQQSIITSAHALHDDDDAEVEIDIDTPFDDRLRGQTQPRAEPFYPTLLNRQMNYGSVTGRVSNVAKKSTAMAKTKKPAAPSVARKSTTLQKKGGKNFATKSTTPRQPSSKSSSNVARKSTSKQSQHLLQVGPQHNMLQFRFGQEKTSSPKVSPFGKTSKITSIPSTSKEKVQKILANYAAKVASSDTSKPFTARKMFTFVDKSEELMGCPECGLKIQHRSLRNHLRNMHNLFMRTCKKCKLSFTDLDLFSEHYAVHLQQQEDCSSGFQRHPTQLTENGTSVLPSGSQKMFEAARKMSTKRPTTEEFHDNFIPESTEVRLPVHPKLPPKPRKPTPSKKRLASPPEAIEPSSSRSLNENSPLAKKKHFSLNSESSHYSQNPSTSRKRYFSQSPSRRHSSSPSSISRENHRERSSSPSLQSEASFNSDFSDTKISSVHNRESKKVPLTKQKTVSTTYIATPEKNRLCEVITVTVSRRYCEEAKVSLVSLENASQPFDCKTCMAAFNTALTCPRSFRQYFQMGSSNHPVGSLGSTEVKAEQEIGTSPLTQHKHSDIPQYSMDTKHKSPLKSPDTAGLYECEICRKRFQYRSLLLRHVAYHSYRYSCGICKKAFQEKIHLLDHFQIAHEGRSRMLCRYCSKEFKSFSELDHHIVSHKGGTEVACTICNQKFSDSKLMHMHLKFTHSSSESFNKQTVERVVSTKPTGKHSCKLCGKRFHLTHQLSVHMKIAHHRPGHKIATKFLSCRICNRVFHFKKGLSSHYRHCHGISLLEAEDADAALLPNVHSETSASFRRKSVPINDARVKVNCPKCEASYTTRKIMLQHYRRHHGQTSVTEMSEDNSSTFECRVCQKVVNTFQGLKTHYKICHKRAMPTSKVVSKKTATYSFFTNVAQKKAGPYKCLKCHKTFSQSTNLSRHMRIFHTNAASMGGNGQRGTWTCQICGVAFRKRKAMRCHIKVFHPENYQDERLGSRKCKKCEKPFGSRTQLLSHMQVCGAGQPLRKSLDEHTGRLYPCLLCEKKFIWKNSAFRHMVINHKLSKRDIVYNISGNVGNVRVGKHKEKNSVGQRSQPAGPKGKFLCKICKDCFTDSRTMKRHQQARHGGDRSGFFQCRIQSCQKTFTRNENLLKHVKGAHPGMPRFRCWGCKAGFDTKEDVLGHSCFPVSVENWEISSESHENEFIEFGQSTSESFETGPSTSQMSEHESRYRCTTCGLGFHVAREWTKHMKEHAVGTGTDLAGYEKVMDTTENIRLNVFDVMSAGDICACQFCGKIYTDKDALAQHKCEKVQNSTKLPSSLNPQTSIFVKNISNYQPVKCPVCLKFFSPLSIRRHMMNLHSLPMKMCKQCNLVFTDIGHFKRHCEMHKQPETIDLEGITKNSDVENIPTVDDSTEESLTFFVCPHCGGLFSDADSLKLHECSGEDNCSEHSDLHEDTVVSGTVPAETIDVTNPLSKPNSSKGHDVSQRTDEIFYIGVVNNATGEITCEQLGTDDQVAVPSIAEPIEVSQYPEILSSKQNGADGELHNKEDLMDTVTRERNSVTTTQLPDQSEISLQITTKNYKETSASGDKSHPSGFQVSQELKEVTELKETADKDLEDKIENQAIDTNAILKDPHIADQNNAENVEEMQEGFENMGSTTVNNQETGINSRTVMEETPGYENIVKNVNQVEEMQEGFENMGSTTVNNQETGINSRTVMEETPGYENIVKNVNQVEEMQEGFENMGSTTVNNQETGINSRIVMEETPGYENIVKNVNQHGAMGDACDKASNEGAIADTGCRVSIKTVELKVTQVDDAVVPTIDYDAMTHASTVMPGDNDTNEVQD